MLISFQHGHITYQADLSQPIDISIALKFNTLNNPNAWFCPMPEAEPQRFGEQKIAVDDGLAINSYHVRLFPHGNGTHTEGVGHLINSERWQAHSINHVLTDFHCLARLISVYPTQLPNGDLIILKNVLEKVFTKKDTKALIIRLLPNDEDKLTRHWSGSNPPYIDSEAMAYIVACGVQHLLIDVPSVDREEDGGKVTAHRLFWADTRAQNCTITEMIYVPNRIKDGLYLLNLQIPSFELDAAPSKPVLYNLIGV